jgi:hypothetical protein
MRLLTEEEIRQLFFFWRAGGLTDEGEALYQRVIKGHLDYDDPWGGEE